MRILLMCLMIFMKGTSYQDKAGLEQSPGFSLEIRNDSVPGIIKESFIDMISIRELPIDSVSIKDSEGKPDREWIGINLCLILEKKLNLSCNQIKKISISAPDGYVSVISGELLSALETGLCAFEIKGEASWPKKYGYMRLLFPDLRGMYWVNSPSKMIIELGDAQKASERFEFYFMDSENFKSLIRQDLKGNPYIAIDDILIELGAPQQSFRILTQDSLFREYGANDINRRLVLQQEPSGTWKMTGIAVPLGLKTRKIFCITTQNKTLFLKPFSTAEQEVFYAIFLQHVMKHLADNAEIIFGIVLLDGKGAPGQTVKPSSNQVQNLYRTIEQQRIIHKNVHHVVLTIGSN